jgi:mannose-6-phosphate isomerase-like protein (cupin superfamily)
MGYKPSPRPTFDGPTHIPYAKVTRHLWGDEASGTVDDWIYVSSDKIHQLVFGLAPGQAFRHSPEFRTVFGADEVLYVLAGRFACANPETGEVQVAAAGEAIFFRRDTWHHGFNIGTVPLRVLEFFAPPPSTGTSGAYARSRPYVEQSRYVQDQWLGRFPMESAALEAQQSMRVLRDADLHWRLEGSNQTALVGLYAATEHLTVGRMILLPGQRSDVVTRGGDTGLYVLEGTLNILTPESDGQRWFELDPRDGFYVPQSVPHQYQNLTAEPVELLFGIAPQYLPERG